MKFTVLLTIVSFFQVQFGLYAQNKEISIDVTKGSLEQVIQEIEAVSRFKFLFNRKVVDVNRVVTIKAKNQQINTILTELFANTDIVFEVVNKQIILSKKKANMQENSTVQFKISGVVYDSDGQPLPGTNIIEKGTANGTQADFDGEFTLTVSDKNAVLTVSYIGFATKEIPLNGQAKLAVVLEESASGLEEVVVVGYGEQVKSRLTGAIASVTSNDIAGFPASSIEQSLNGKMAGVQLSQSSGQPGAGISIRVRGISSISGGNEPLYVVDGVPFFSSDVRGLNGMSSINPNDIASIQVLKDASATAIYGSRGANGVVMITTKSGVSNESSIRYNTWVSTRSILKKLPLMNGAEFIDFQKRFFTNSGLEIPDEINQINNADTNWQEEILQSGVATNHDISISGGTAKSQYYISLGYLNENGIIINSDFERFSLRANLSSSLNDYLSIKSAISASNSVQNGFSEAENNNTFGFVTSGVGSTLLALPTEPIFDEDGNYSNIFPYDFSAPLENPVGYANNVVDKTTVNRFLGNVTLKANIVNGLYNNTRMGIDYQNRRNDIYYPNNFEIILGGNGAAILQTNEKLNYVLENFINYKTTILDNFYIDAVLGASIQKETSKSTFLQSTGFFSNELGNNAIQAGSSFSTPLTNNIDQSIASIFGRINANYKDKYLFGVSVRKDGASVFSASNKTATFPAFSAGWQLSKEEFLVDHKVISNLKIRASWGNSGNPGIQPYQSLPLGQIVITSQGAGSGLNTGLAPNLPNRNLTWETTTQTDIGVDFGLLSDNLSISFDYYKKTTKDALASVQLPPSGGFSTIIDNVGEVQNEGVELFVGAKIIESEDLKLSMSFNVSNNHNVVTKTKNNQDLVSNISFGQTANADGGIASVVRVGEQLGAFLGFNFIGFDADGVPQYEDFDDNGVIDAEDITVIGNPIPEILYGFNASLYYKNISFSIDWQGQSNVDVLNLGLLNLTAPDNEYNRLSTIYDYYPNPNQSLVHRVSNRYVENAAFLRLKNIKFGYNIPISNTFIKNVVAYISGQNLITITDYSGFDPDVNSLSGNDVRQGIDLGSYPSSRAYTLGLNVKF